MSDKLLELTDLSIKFDGKQAVKHVSLSFTAGKTLAIVGASGSGKSTILNAVQGTLPLSAEIKGKMLFAGETLDRGRARQLAGKEITMVFQNATSSFCPTRTVKSQLFELAAAHTAWTQEDFLQRTQVLMEKLALSAGTLEKYPFELSGGMGQRVGILAAMLLSPRLLLADEPTSALDKVTQRKVVRELKSLVETQSMAMLLVTHHIGVAAYLADEILVMKDGEVIEQGTAKSVLNHPQTAYAQELIRSTLYSRRILRGGAAEDGDTVRR